jgi:hypothetical protein
VSIFSAFDFEQREKQNTAMPARVLLISLIACTTNGLTFLSPASVAGQKPFAPIPERNLHLVLKTWDGRWGMVGTVLEPPDKTGCSSNGWEGRNLNDTVVFLAGVQGCSSEDKQRGEICHKLYFDSIRSDDLFKYGKPVEPWPLS